MFFGSWFKCQIQIMAFTSSERNWFAFSRLQAIFPSPGRSYVHFWWSPILFSCGPTRPLGISTNSSCLYSRFLGSVKRHQTFITPASAHGTWNSVSLSFRLCEEEGDVDKEVTSTSYLLPVVWLLFHCVVVVQSDIRVRGEHFPFRSFYATYSTAVQKSAVRISFIYIHINVYIYTLWGPQYIYTHTYIHVFIFIYWHDTHTYIYIHILYYIHITYDMTNHIRYIKVTPCFMYIIAILTPTRTFVQTDVPDNSRAWPNRKNVSIHEGN